MKWPRGSVKPCGENRVDEIYFFFNIGVVWSIYLLRVSAVRFICRAEELFTN